MAERIKHFSDLLIWRRSIELGKQVYALTKRFPVEERYGLTSQIRRAALSVSSNIAEGHARQGREFLSFLSIARGSLAETESQLLFAVAIGYVSAEEIVPIQNLATEVRRMSAALSKALKARREASA